MVETEPTLMDQKTWLWRKKSSERTITMRNKSNLLDKGQEKQKAAELERSLQDLNEQLSFARTECYEKDIILAKQAKVAEEAILGWEKAEAEAVSIKEQFDGTLCQKAALEEKLSKLDEALKVAKEEHELIIVEAAEKISCEQVKVRKLEDHVAEKSKMIANLGVKNDDLSEMLATKEKLIKELLESMRLSEENLSDLTTKLESVERANSSLRYEVCMLQKQLEIRSEERKFNLKSADVAHKQHLESVKKITKLEAECQRLRSMVRKRLPGPAAIAKMRNEVEMLGNTTTSAGRRSNSTTSFNSRDSSLDGSYGAAHGSAAPLLARLNAIEDENKIMKESLASKDGELQLSQTLLAHTTSKLSQVEAQLEELSKAHGTIDLVKGSPILAENPLSSISEFCGNEDNISCTGSWASALISELEHFKKGKLTAPSCKSTGLSDLSFMDDFAEMEKLAIACADKPIESSHVPPGDNTSRAAAMENDSRMGAPETTGKVLVPVDGPSEANNQICQHKKIEKSILKLVELVEGIIQRSSKDNDSQLKVSGGEAGASYDQSASLTGYVARAFLWKTSQLIAVLQHFVVVCNEILYGNADLEKFVLEVNLTLDWIISHCFSLRDVSDMRESIIKHLELNCSNGLEAVAIAPCTGINGMDHIDEPKTPNGFHVSLIPVSDCANTLSIKQADAKPGYDIQYWQKHYTENAGDGAFITSLQESASLQESEGKVSNLRAELNALKESGKMIGGHAMENKLIHKDHGAHESISKSELKEADQMPSHLGRERKNNSTYRDESGLQLECYSAKQCPQSVAGHEDKHLKIQLEISTASEKLIECQETILNLEKQLKALAAPKEAALLHKVIDKASSVQSKPRSQSLNQILAEDDDKSDLSKSPKTKEIICAEPGLVYERNSCTRNDPGDDNSIKCITHPTPVKSPGKQYGVTGPCKNDADAKLATLALVPRRQKKGTNFLKRLLMSSKKEVIAKPKLTVSA